MEDVPFIPLRGQQATSILLAAGVKSELHSFCHATEVTQCFGHWLSCSSSLLPFPQT